MKHIRVAVSQINPIVGDLSGNRDKIITDIQLAKNADCDLVVFPELAVTGYHPEDLLLKPKFIEDNLKTLKQIIPETKGITAIIGYARGKVGNLHDSAAIIHDGKLVASYDKGVIASFDIYDEIRYFKRGTRNPLFNIGGIKCGISIGEDAWDNDICPVVEQGSKGAELLINISAASYYIGKASKRYQKLKRFTRKFNVPFIYANLVGGQDEMIFDGTSMVLTPDGEIKTGAKQLKEDIIFSDIEVPEYEQTGKIVTICDEFVPHAKKKIKEQKLEKLTHARKIYRALILGTHDYVVKNGFDTVVVGLSGGMDSALVATIAVDALGKEKVKCVAMPSRFSSDESYNDARDLCDNLGIDLMVLPIEKVYKAYLDSLKEVFKGTVVNTTEENIQARIRGNFLMALSNKFGWLVLTTGNKSETATGYTTLYGDMAGGFAVIKDLPKTKVYEIARYRNSVSKVIPINIIKKAPSAELRPNQKDSDFLPPYEILDPILSAYVEKNLSVDDIVQMGFNEADVKKTARLVDLNEYKRRQGPPGIKLTTRSFGRDRRFPITNQYRGV